jgi:hypothetical protein
MAQSAMANKSCSVNLLWGAGTQMALWFYAMVHLLGLWQPLAATIHQQRFVDLNLNDSVRAAVHNIKDNVLEVRILVSACCIPRPQVALLLQ